MDWLTHLYCPPRSNTLFLFVGILTLTTSTVLWLRLQRMHFWSVLHFVTSAQLVVLVPFIASARISFPVQGVILRLRLRLRVKARCHMTKYFSFPSFRNSRQKPGYKQDCSLPHICIIAKSLGKQSLSFFPLKSLGGLS